MTPEQSQDLELWRKAFAVRMDKFERRLDENTEVTKRVDTNTTELVDIMNSWKGAIKVLEFLGKLAKPLAAITTFFAVWFAFWPRK